MGRRKKYSLGIEYEQSLFRQMENNKLQIIDVDSSKVSYNQLNAINILANKLKDQEIKYSANKSAYNIKLIKITKLHPNEILFLLYLESTIIGYGLIRKHEIIKNAVFLEKLYIDYKSETSEYYNKFLKEIELILKNKYNIESIYINCLYCDPINIFYINNDYRPTTITYIKPIK